MYSPDLRPIFDFAVSAPLQIAREAVQDSKHALREWARKPLHTAFAIAALAIGIGANTGIFSVVNALLIRSLPFRNPGKLVKLYIFAAPHDSAKSFHDWRETTAFLEDAALVEQGDVNLAGAGDVSRAHVAQASSNFFSVMGVHPIIGREFSSGEDAAGRNRIAIIGYGLWQQAFGGDRRVLSATIRVDGVSLSVIGVAPPGFDYPGGAVLWKPAEFTPGNNGWETIARLKSEITWQQAQTAFKAEAERLDPNRTLAVRQAHPPLMIRLQVALSNNPNAPPNSPVTGKNAALALMAAASLILLVACTNVANLLLARAAGRVNELSIRSALGASRARLTRQLLTESVLLSLAASAVGLFVAHWTVSIAARVQPAPIATQSYSILDARVLGFGFAITILCGLLFGVLPALYASRTHSFAARGSSAGHTSRAVRGALVAAQVALTIVLLSNSLSMIRAFAKLAGMDRGFDGQGVATVSLSVAGTREQGQRALGYFQDVVQRVRNVPGVRSASATEFLPLAATAFMGAPFSLDGRRAREFQMVVPVLPGYFQTMGGRIEYGREFTEADLQSDTAVAVVNDDFAREFGNPADSIGRQLRVGGSRPRTVIGVVHQMVYMGDYNHTQVFFPDRSPGSFFVTIVARVDGRAENRLPSVRDAVKSVDPDVPLFDVKTMDQRLDEALLRPKFYSGTLLFFAAFALLLAVIGIYGVVSFFVVQRTHEMGVRIALGTTPGNLRKTMLWRGLIPVALGAVPGILGAVAAGRFGQTLIEGTIPTGMVFSTVAALFIAAIAASAIWIATRRVARLDVMNVLRAE